MSVQIVDAFRGIEKRPSNFFRKEEKQKGEEKKKNFVRFSVPSLSFLHVGWIKRRLLTTYRSLGVLEPLSRFELVARTERT